MQCMYLKIYIQFPYFHKQAPNIRFHYPIPNLKSILRESTLHDIDTNKYINVRYVRTY